ncbi:hypothetical protein WME98_44335 [Sorangium sp. So ce296]
MMVWLLLVVNYSWPLGRLHDVLLHMRATHTPARTARRWEGAWMA